MYGTAFPSRGAGISTLTIADVLTLPEAAAGCPRVVTGKDLLSRRVRWIHVAEQASVARLLDGGELLLTTGVGWPDTARGRDRFIANCTAGGAVGFVVELGGTWKDMPGDVIDSCRRHGMPLIELTTEVRFSRVTREVHERIVDDHLRAVEAMTEVSDTFTRMIRNGAPTERLVTEASRILHCPVVLEDVSHMVVIAEESNERLSSLLSGWRTRSAAILRPAEIDDDRSYSCRTDDGLCWTVAPVHVRGREWGRLLALGNSDHPAGTARVLRQAAVALAIDRLSSDETNGWTDLVRTAAMARLLDLPSVSPDDTRAALAASGFPINGRLLFGAEVEVGGDSVQPGVLADAVGDSMPGIQVLAARSSTTTGTTLAVSVPSNTTGQALDHALREALTCLMSPSRTRLRVVRGPGARNVPELLASIKRAQNHAQETPHWWWREAALPGSPEITVVAEDTLAPVLDVLTGDVRVQSFAEEALGKVVRYDSRNGTDLLDVLRAVVQNPQSRARAAKESHLSRTSFYNRLATLERLLGMDLSDGDDLFRVSLALWSRDGNKGTMSS